MSRIAYVNGQYTPLREAQVSALDRGFVFGDGVYEVWSVAGGQLKDAPGHFARLERSLDALRIARPMGRAALALVLRETVRRNRVRNGLVYLQVTRGAAMRDHVFPNPPVAPGVFAFAKPLDFAAMEAKARKGARVVTCPDLRWGRCDIKSVNLLPNVLARQHARDAGADEAWLVDDQGLITEAAASNAWIVDKEGRLRTRDLQANILPGITRAALLGIAAEHGLEVSTIPFTLAEAKEAREAFHSAANAWVMPVISIDGHQIGDGTPGPIARALRSAYSLLA